MPHAFSLRFAALLLVVASALNRRAVADEADARCPCRRRRHEVRPPLQARHRHVLRYAIDHRASIRSTIDETTQEAQTKTDSVKAWKVTDVLPNGEIEFMNVVERVHMVNQLPDRAPAEYDSAQRQNAAARLRRRGPRGRRAALASCA